MIEQNLQMLETVLNHMCMEGIDHWSNIYTLYIYYNYFGSVTSTLHSDKSNLQGCNHLDYLVITANINQALPKQFRLY